ncbi:MAG: YbfB/YjiJ family MFS transporter [Pseudomonadota bacterium]|nr:YbfB/YjiJ family MFS transporter [Pseudomonadota bacterium]
MPIWLRLSIAGAATLLVGMGLGRFSYSPLIPALIEQGWLTATEAGTAGVGNFVGYLIGAFAAPSLRRFFGEVGALRLSLLATLIALVSSTLPWGFLWITFWRAVAGAAVGVIMIYALSITTRFAPRGKLGLATSITYTGVGLGILLAGTAVPLLLQFSVSLAWFGISIAGFFATLVAFWGLRAVSRTNERKEQETAHPSIAWSWNAIAIITARTLFSLGLIPHTIYWVDYLVRGLGNSNSFGGLHWTLFGIGAICGTYLWGRLADRIGFHIALPLAFTIVASGIALPVLIHENWVLIISSLIVGAQPGLTAILSGRVHQLMGKNKMPIVWRAAALVSTTIQAAGGFLYVLIFASTSSYIPVFLTGAAFMGTGAIIAWAMREENH